GVFSGKSRIIVRCPVFGRPARACAGAGPALALNADPPLLAGRRTNPYHVRRLRRPTFSVAYTNNP
ncbi:MAG: hypothetical protein ACUVXJ_06720, partial [Phycisphaerae bacterium]